MRAISYSRLVPSKDHPTANSDNPASLSQLSQVWLYNCGSSVVTATLWWASSELLQLPAPGRVSRNLQPAAGESGEPLLSTADCSKSSLNFPQDDTELSIAPATFFLTIFWFKFKDLTFCVSTCWEGVVCVWRRGLLAVLFLNAQTHTHTPDPNYASGCIHSPPWAQLISHSHEHASKAIPLIYCDFK